MPEVQPTNNPVPSDHPADARDNFKRLDEVLNLQAPVTSPTRTGVVLDTIYGVSSRYIASAINGGIWAAGIEFTAYNQYMAFNGVTYKPSFSTSLPYTTQGADPTAVPDSNFIEPFSDLNSFNLTEYSALSFPSVSDMKSGSQRVTSSQIDARDIIAKTIGYYGGWAATVNPRGGASYILTTRQRVRDSLGDQAWVPDEAIDHYLFGGTDYVATLQYESRINAFQAGAMGNLGDDFDPDAAQAIFNKRAILTLDKGKYLWNKSVNPHQGAVIEGSGFKNRDCEIIISNGVTAIGHANSVVNGTFAELKDIKMSGVAWSGAGASVVRVEDADIFYDVEWEVIGCWFSQSLQAALQARFLTSKVTDNRFGQSEGLIAHAQHRMLYMKGTSAPAFAEVNNNVILLNRFRECPAGGFAIYADFGFDLTVKWNTFQACANFPIVLRGIYPAVMESNYFEANTASSYCQMATDTATGLRWCLVDWRSNFAKQASGLESYIETSNDLRMWADFHGNSGDVKYLTRRDDGAGGFVNDDRVRHSLNNFTGTTYLGSKTFQYHKLNWSPTASIEGYRLDNEINQQYEFGNSTTGISIGGVSNYRGFTGIHALVEGLSENSNTSIGVKSNRGSESATVRGGWDGTTYTQLLMALRATDGFMTVPGVYANTVGDAANVTVDSSGQLRRSSSSRRYKENERELTVDSSDVLDLVPCLFDFKDRVTTDGDTEEGQKNVTGLIAEEAGRFASLDLNGDPDGINWNLITLNLLLEVKKLREELSSK